jgi:hypothetical protein
MSVQRDDRKHSLLFVNPDYHCSFFLRDEFRRMGWKCDVIKNSGYPQTLLWSNDCITMPDTEPERERLLDSLASTYKYFICYGDPEVLRVGDPSRLTRWVTKTFGSWELAYLRMRGCKVAFFPSGCKQEVLRADFNEFQDGRVCANCGWADGACDDKVNAETFRIVNRFHSLVIENSPIESRRIRKEPVRYKSLDLQVFNPEAEIPGNLRMPANGKVRIMHSFFDENRTHAGKNIKGSPFVADAVRRLEAEGWPVEYMAVRDVPAREMRFHQMQADIIVDQLIYGWWGSTTIESLALGKPTVCFLWPEWRERFLATYPEYERLPVVEAGTDSIYEVLKSLVADPARRHAIGLESREFATRHFDVRKNAPALAARLLRL